MGANSDVQYAIKKQKKAKATKIITHKAMAAARKALDKAEADGKPEKVQSKMAAKAAKKMTKKTIKSGYSTLGFGKADMKSIVKEAIQLAKKERENERKQDL